jgi:hypothetical protein
MKSMNTGDAQTGAVLVGAMPVMAQDSAGDGQILGRGWDAETETPLDCATGRQPPHGTLGA